MARYLLDHEKLFDGLARCLDVRHHVAIPLVVDILENISTAIGREELSSAVVDQPFDTHGSNDPQTTEQAATAGGGAMNIPWLSVWSWVLLGALALFSCLTVAVTIGGAIDIRKMLTQLRRQHRDGEGGGRDA